MAKVIETDDKPINTINAGTSITGDVNCSGNIRINGSLTGNLNVQGRVVVGTSGVIKGEVICKNSQIEGKIEGKITVAELLSLKATSSIIGDIHTKKLAIEPGANFTGTCKMNGASTTQPVLNDDKKK